MLCILPDPKDSLDALGPSSRSHGGGPRAEWCQKRRPSAPSRKIQPLGFSSGPGMLGLDSVSSHGGGPRAKLCQ
eukprot:Skav226762  [mRNA]  locus=scaffold8:103094:104639:- [translate_table: standard]